MKKTILVLRNGGFVPMMHDNFMLNVANKSEVAIRPIEKELEKGQIIKVGKFYFKQEKTNEVSSSS